ncbi:MAG: membrane protein insertion efficiency factor YidD [Actinomycetota bacterium]|nr:membrane protein insertion efficiency factor YidD [Actinomycetota bacterium]
MEKTRRAFRLFFLFPVELYRWLVSPTLGKTCKYYPTCSEYFEQAVLKYGIVRGSIKGIYRILRCNPLSAGGYDPP